MEFLIYPVDFTLLIQSTLLSQITGGAAGMTLDVLEDAELLALEEATSKLVQRFDVTRAMSPMQPWSPSVVYQAFNWTYLTATAYVSTNTYNIGQIVLQAGIVYSATANGVTGAFNPSQWTSLGNQYAIFNAPPPNPEFQFTGTYNIGDFVFWHGKVYKCLIATMTLGQETAIQFVEYQNIPAGNVDPENVNYGSNYWAYQSTYTVPAGTLPTNTAYWAAGDTRSQQLVRYLVDIVLYHVHARIAPENIPENRESRYKRAMKWLDDFKGGEATPSIPVLQPQQGMRIRYGGPVKNQNSY